jgi:ABC-2 type transport system ATP-binding protein
MISCRNLTRRFGGFTAVDNLTLDISAGTICAFLGPNGAGKSTTVKMLTGLLAPSSGEALVCGLNVAKEPLAVKRRIGVLPEDLGLFDDLTIEEHLLLTGQIYGLTSEIARARIEQLLSALSLAHGRNTFASQCSHGMRKKTAFAMALLPNPEVLFLGGKMVWNSPAGELPRSLEDLYFELAEEPVTEELDWLGTRRS